MAFPKSVEARNYYRASKQRSDDALLLLEAGLTTGAVFLAGYTIECMLKALVLANVAAKVRTLLLRDFRGNRGHNIEWLRALYRRHVGHSVPLDITRHLSRVASWTTDLRYETGLLSRRDADEFFSSVAIVTNWADGRI